MNAPNSLRDALISSPSLFPLNLDSTGSLVQLLNLSESDYQAASFLDSRLLTEGTRQAVVPWPEFQSSATGLVRKCHFIFHISHAGSTLLSRLLGTHPTLFSIREPNILRFIAQGAFPDRLDLFLGLWSRTYRPTQTTLIKATSFVSEIATTLMSSVPDSRALLMYVPLETFLPALLDGAMSDISSQAEFRLRRLQQRGVLGRLTLSDLSPGECVAMSWLSEMESLNETARMFPDRVQWLDFDQFLLKPEPQLQAAFAHFGLQTDVATLLSGPIMQRYAKRPEVKYDMAFRSNLLAASQLKFAEEIERGLHWLRNVKPM